MLKKFLQTFVVTSFITLISFSPVIGMEKEDDGNRFHTPLAYNQSDEEETIEEEEERISISPRPHIKSGCEKWLDECEYHLNCCQCHNFCWEENISRILCLPLTIPKLMCSLPYYLCGCDKECCLHGRPSDFHWGLSHWIAGIGEYFERCLCCGTSKKNGKYYMRNSYGIEVSSDCLLVDLENGVCDNPVSGALCCPLVAAGHLLFLPFACCECSPQREMKFVYVSAPSPHLVYVPPPPSAEELVRRAAEHAERNRIWASDSPETKKRKSMGLL